MMQNLMQVLYRVSGGAIGTPYVVSKLEAAVIDTFGSQKVLLVDANGATTGTSNPAFVSSPLAWSVSHAPAIATRAVATKAAVAGQRHVLMGIMYAAAVAVTAPLRLQVRDGATGAGTVLLEITFGATVGIASATPFYIPGSVNTAMTIEFDTPPGATAYQSVNMWGFTI